MELTSDRNRKSSIERDFCPLYNWVVNLLLSFEDSLYKMGSPILY